jgi:hypothetical protein
MSETLILNSITKGKRTKYKHTSFQAISAAVTETAHLELVLESLSKDAMFLEARSKILAFRTKDEEGYDDDGEIGAGEKLLYLLERMGIENIVIIVCVWDDYEPGRLGLDLFRIVLEKAKELLVTLHA